MSCPQRSNGEHDDLDPLPLREIVEKIKLGMPVEYDEVSIEWDLDFNDLPLPTTNTGQKIVSSPIIITNSDILGKFNLNNVFFIKSVSFENTVFCDDVNFQGTSFSITPAFTNAKFEMDSNFINVEFFEGVVFIGTEFKGETLFNNAKFIKSAHFEGSTFSLGATFIDATFHETAKFTKSIFHREVEFQDTNFYEDFLLDEALFHSDVNLMYKKLKGNLYLNAEFKKSLTINWDKVKNHLFSHEDTYLSMIEILKKQASYDEADDCYYQYRKWMLKKRNNISKKITDYFIFGICGFGVRPSFTATWLILLVFFFSITFYCFRGVENSLNSRTELSFLEIFLFSAQVFIGRTTEGLGINPINLYWKYIVVLETALGYMFIAVFIALIGRQILKEL